MEWENTDCEILIGTLSDDLVPAIFGPVPFFNVGMQRGVVELPANATMIDVLFEAQIFPSKSQARKNWKGPIEVPFGSHLFTLGKKKLKVFVHRAVMEN